MNNPLTYFAFACAAFAAGAAFCGPALDVDRIQGIVLRAQDVPGTEGARRESRVLLSTEDGLCAVRLPGGEESWSGYADATVEIFGVLTGMEFVVESKSAVRVIKYPPAGDTLSEVLPAGEIVYRHRIAAERERRRRERIATFLGLGAGVFAALVAFSALWVYALRGRRKARRLAVDLVRERRRVGQLHESVEQRLTGAKMLLQVALDMAGDGEVSTPLATAAAKAADEIGAANSDVHTANLGTKGEGRKRP